VPLLIVLEGWEPRSGSCEARGKVLVILATIEIVLCGIQPRTKLSDGIRRLWEDVVRIVVAI
jgi:hypothetical protein